MKKYDFLFIDADETILDFHGAERQAFEKIIESVGLSETPELYSTYKTINKGLWGEIEKGDLSINAMVEGLRF